MTKTNDWKYAVEENPEIGKACYLRLLTFCEGVRNDEESFKINEEKPTETQVIAWKYKDENN